ncbi:MAG: fibronectin type III domain-containing protein [Desulfobacterales bacterium]|nr:fibronectin type III domain-containing protein [Desulfobacterales bacterium]
MMDRALNRRAFLKMTGATGAMAAAFQPVAALSQGSKAQEVENRVFAASAIPDRILLIPTEDSARSQCVTWRTWEKVSNPLAQIAVADGSPHFTSSAVTVPGTTSVLKATDGKDWRDYYHRVFFTGLEPEASYHYRLGDGSTWSEWFLFKTSAETLKPFSFIYLGDAQNNILSEWSHVVRRARVQDPDIRFMLHAGDLVNHEDSDEEWGQWHQGDGWAQSGISCLATPGNHEYKLESISPQWNHQFAFPGNGPDSRRLTNTVYYVDYQNVRFISLDTTLMHNPYYARKQRIWLKECLKNNPCRWTIAFHHHPMRAGASGRTGHFLLNLHIRPLYEKYGVHLVLQGHDHTYARGSLKPIFGKYRPTYMVSVSGPKMYTASASWADVSVGNRQVFQHISVDEEALHVKSLISTGELVDSFSLNHAGV